MIIEEVLLMFLATIVAVVTGSVISARLIRRGTSRDIERALRKIVDEILEREDVKRTLREGGDAFIKIREFLESDELPKTLEALRKALDKL